MPFTHTPRGRTETREGPARQSGHASSTPNPSTLESVRLQTVQDVIDVLEEQVQLVRAESSAGALEKARTVGFLAGIALKAIEAGHLAARLEMLERVLQHRTAEANP